MFGLDENYTGDYSNTTLVKVKLEKELYSKEEAYKFKYNTC